jgi:hypothetical protein
MGRESTCSWLSWPPQESVSVWMNRGVDVTSMCELTEPTAKNWVDVIDQPLRCRDVDDDSCSETLFAYRQSEAAERQAPEN